MSHVTQTFQAPKAVGDGKHPQQVMKGLHTAPQFATATTQRTAITQSKHLQSQITESGIDSEEVYNINLCPKHGCEQVPMQPLTHLVSWVI